ncbi:ankyrin repeat domain-containing protein 12-like [Schistocerca nitens]|uniref:ankyrin repeat domain-containing protein 12-like n=1 Tax=Schistocerca nitens TaxID=7011 RepID=UPI002118AE9D|nr:ankyrin repeat domain-containing protein 12-like [Schistocerca nitens]
MIEAGARVDVTDHHGRTPLHYVGQSRNLGNYKGMQGMNGIMQLTRMMIEAGARVNVADDHGRTPLHYAAQAGNYKYVKELLKAGADVKAMDMDGATPLLMQSSCNCHEAVRLLWAAGSNFLDIPQECRNRAVHLAVTSGDLEDQKIDKMTIKEDERVASFKVWDDEQGENKEHEISMEKDTVIKTEPEVDKDVDGTGGVKQYEKEQIDREKENEVIQMESIESEEEETSSGSSDSEGGEEEVPEDTFLFQNADEEEKINVFIIGKDKDVATCSEEEQSLCAIRRESREEGSSEIGCRKWEYDNVERDLLHEGEDMGDIKAGQPFVKMKTYGREQKDLLDTGSEISAVSEEFYNCIKEGNEVMDIPVSGLKIMGATGKLSKVVK